jgi:hypothetical protein
LRGLIAGLSEHEKRMCASNALEKFRSNFNRQVLKNIWRFALTQSNTEQLAYDKGQWTRYIHQL